MGLAQLIRNIRRISKGKILNQGYLFPFYHCQKGAAQFVASARNSPLTR